jgi:DnaJ homolog subfamily A member 2
LEGLNSESHNEGRSDAGDLFDIFFGASGVGGRSKSSQSSRPNRGEDINHPLNASLVDLYNGKTVKMAVNRQVLDGRPVDCSKCQGVGVNVEMRQIASGMVQQIRRNCSDCHGIGSTCNVKKERKILEIHIAPGMVHNQKVTFNGMADEKPNIEPGNVNFVIQELKHPIFTRKGADLLITKKLSLKQALTGFAWKVKHLDGRDLVIQSKPGEIIQAVGLGGKPFVKLVPDEGMPCHGNPFVKGGLYVLFSIDFPKDGELSEEAVDALRKFLPTQDGTTEELSMDPTLEEIVHLQPADVQMFGKGGISGSTTSSRAQSENQDFAEGRPQPVNCQQS